MNTNEFNNCSSCRERRTNLAWILLVIKLQIILFIRIFFVTILFIVISLTFMDIISFSKFKTFSPKPHSILMFMIKSWYSFGGAPLVALTSQAVFWIRLKLIGFFHSTEAKVESETTKKNFINDQVNTKYVLTSTSKDFPFLDTLCNSQSNQFCQKHQCLPVVLLFHTVQNQNCLTDSPRVSTTYCRVYFM